MYTNIEDISCEQYSTIILSSEDEKLGNIIASNLTACNMFGYTKQEMLGRNIKILMPNLIGVKHDTFLANYLNTK